LTGELQVTVMNEACAQAKGRVPVLVGITHSSFAESLKMAEAAADAGASAVVMAPPPYFPMQGAELLHYLEALASRNPLPLFLYNIPSFAGVCIDPETAVKAAEIPGIVGYKDSAGDMLEFQAVRRATAGKDDFCLMMGREELLPEALIFGADGGVPGGANLFPGLYVELYDASRTNDIEKVREIRETIFAVSESIYTLDQSCVGFIKGMKAALSLMGICGDRMTSPFETLPASRKAELKRRLERLHTDFGLAV
jgi:4-hydroxy-tetrahydrodipicolinate synthase